MFRQLYNYTQKVKSFHMPGHKGGKLSLINDFHKIDVTEVEGTDDLHHPRGIIKDTLDEISRIYKSGKSYMLVNGATGGILSAISGVTKARDSIIIARNCHKAVYNSVYINQLEAKYIYPELNKQYGFYEEINLRELEDLIIDNPESKALVITSPTYEGLVSDIKSIGELAHRYNKVLIVDEAHGAHFTFSDYLPKSALELGADIVIQSTHKTLPALTQTAIMHISEEAISSARVKPKNIEKYLSIYQTSSPSYVFMASVEAAIKYMNDHKALYSEWLFELEEKLASQESKYGRWLYEFRNAEFIDVTRLTYLINDSVKTMTGWKLSQELRDKHNIQVELSSQNYIIAIATIADDIEDIVELINAIECVFDNLIQEDKVKEDFLVDIKSIMSNPRAFIEGQVDKSRMTELKKPKQVYSIYEASLKDSETIRLSASVDRICSDFIIPYPPGIPLLVPGEELTKELVTYIEYLIGNKMEVYGIIEGAIQVLE